MLHECGHYLIGEKEKHERYGMGYSQLDPAVKATFAHKSDVVEEEYEAWWRGLKLARRLNIALDKSRFDEVRLSTLKT
jgi:hypothetical protein